MLDWTLDSDPSIRWQALRDLAAARVVGERARVATEGWEAQAASGREARTSPRGAMIPVKATIPTTGIIRTTRAKPWTATAYSLLLLIDLGVDPRGDQVRRAVALVRDHSRWEEGGQPFFTGEVEPCINGMTVALGAYFDQDVDGVVARLLGEQLDDGGWNCWAGYGSVRSSFATTINVLEGLLAHERATGGSAESIAARCRGEGS